MTTLKNAIIAISLLLVTMILTPTICAQDVPQANPSSASDKPVIWTPSDIAVDTGGNVYVTDNWADRVWKYSPSGDEITHWGSKGSGEGQFSVPAHIAIDNKGFVYITDIHNNRIQKFTSEGMYISHWNFLPRGLIECSPIDTSPRKCWGEAHSFGGITTGADGNLYIVDGSNNSIHKTTPDGKYLAKWGSEGTGKGQFSNPTDIAFDREGNFFVADTANNRVQKFSADGTFLTTWGSKGPANGQFFSPGGISVDRKGFVYVVDSTLNCVQKFTGSGIFVTRWGKKGTKDGEFNLASDVAVDDNDNVYVTDFSNNRIQKFTANGLFLMKWVGAPPPPDPNPTPRVCGYLDDEMWMNVTEYLVHVNEELLWGLSDEQIRQHSEKVQNTLDKKYVTSKNWIHICSFSQLSDNLRDTGVITEEQHLSLLYYEQKQRRYGIAYMEVPGFKAPETPHFVINGQVSDAECRPIPDAMVKFESNLVIEKTPRASLVTEDTPLSSSTRSGTDGTYHINVAWGNRQNASVTKEGYVKTNQYGIDLTNDSNTIDFQLIRQPASTSGFTFTGGIIAVLFGGLGLFYNQRNR